MFARIVVPAPRAVTAVMVKGAPAGAALFGVAVAALGGASLSLVVAFWCLGATAVAVQAWATASWRRRRVADQTAMTPPLPEDAASPAAVPTGAGLRERLAQRLRLASAGRRVRTVVEPATSPQTDAPGLAVNRPVMDGLVPAVLAAGLGSREPAPWPWSWPGNTDPAAPARGEVLLELVSLLEGIDGVGVPARATTAVVSMPRPATFTTVPAPTRPMANAGAVDLAAGGPDAETQLDESPLFFHDDVSTGPAANPGPDDVFFVLGLDVPPTGPEGPSDGTVAAPGPAPSKSRRRPRSAAKTPAKPRGRKKAAPVVETEPVPEPVPLEPEPAQARDGQVDAWASTGTTVLVTMAIPAPVEPLPTRIHHVAPPPGLPVVEAGPREMSDLQECEPQTYEDGRAA
jgi:hypothetical protein